MDISKHKVMINGKPSRLPPGFRFHPKDEELLFEYLAKKIFKQPAHYSLLEIESCNVDPWELLGERDRIKYFFSKMKHNIIRETTSGYWKVVEPEIEIKDSNDKNNNNYPVKGMKQTLVFFFGNMPSGSITKWVMEEFRLVYPASNKPSFTQLQKVNLEEWIAVKIFKKIEDGDEEEHMEEEATFSLSSSSSSESGTDESEGEEVIQSK